MTLEDDTIDINDSDFDENKARVFSSIDQVNYSPKRYPEDLRRSPSRLFEQH